MVRKIAVTLDHKTVTDLDRWVREGRYPNRSRALQSAVDLLTEREKRSRLARELKKLDPIEEQALPKRESGIRLGRDSERRDLLGRSRSCSWERAGRLATGIGSEQRSFQSAFRDGDCHGDHESTAAGRLPAHAGAATGLSATRVVGQDFPGPNDFGRAYRKARR